MLGAFVDIAHLQVDRGSQVELLQLNEGRNRVVRLERRVAFEMAETWSFRNYVERGGAKGRMVVVFLACLAIVGGKV